MRSENRRVEGLFEDQSQKYDPSPLASTLCTNDPGCLCKVEEAYGPLCTF